MKSYGKPLRIILLAVVTILAFWLVVLKLIVKIGKKLGIHVPCPTCFNFILQSPYRLRRLEKALDRVGIETSDNVLELGPGPGVMTVDAAHRLGPQGKLFAVDIQPEMIARLQRRLREAGVTNVETIVADACDLPLPSESVDRAFLVDVLSEIHDQDRALSELWRVLKPGALLSITEEFMDPDYPLARTVIRLAEANGFRLDQRFGNFFQYAANFRKSNTSH